MAGLRYPPGSLTLLPYHAHFFDFDHTLFDSDASEALAFEHALTSNATTSNPELFAIYKRINSALWAEVESGVRGPSDVRTLRFVQLVEQTSIDLDPLVLADSFTSGMQEFGELYPGALDVLGQLRECGPVVMVTNAISEIQRRRIERLGIGALFDLIVISSEVGVSKPAPGIFDHAFQSISETAIGVLDRKATLMVGDSLTSDMTGGVAAGLATCWFNPHAKSQTSSLGIDHEISRLDQLLSL